MGFSHYGTKLTKDQISLIRAKAARRELLKQELASLSNKAIAKELKVSPTTISCVINYWYHYGTARKA